MADIYVVFEDATEARIVTVFGGPQDRDWYAHYAVVQDTDQRYLDFLGLTAPASPVAPN
jgi:hypothetical protein